MSKSQQRDQFSQDHMSPSDAVAAMADFRSKKAVLTLEYLDHTFCTEVHPETP